MIACDRVWPQRSLEPRVTRCQWIGTPPTDYHLCALSANARLRQFVADDLSEAWSPAPTTGEVRRCQPRSRPAAPRASRQKAGAAGRGRLWTAPAEQAC